LGAGALISLADVPAPLIARVPLAVATSSTVAQTFTRAPGTAIVIVHSPVDRADIDIATPVMLAVLVVAVARCILPTVPLWQVRLTVVALVRFASVPCPPVPLAVAVLARCTIESIIATTVPAAPAFTVAILRTPRPSLAILSLVARVAASFHAVRPAPSVLLAPSLERPMRPAVDFTATDTC
jgi:hypothetical protein